MACNDARRGGSAIDARTTRHPGYAASQVIRKRIEEHFGWGKTVGRIRQTVYRGLRRVDLHFKLTMTASNIVPGFAQLIALLRSYSRFGQAWIDNRQNYFSV